MHLLGKTWKCELLPPMPHCNRLAVLDNRIQILVFDLARKDIDLSKQLSGLWNLPLVSSSYYLLILITATVQTLFLSCHQTCISTFSALARSWPGQLFMYQNDAEFCYGVDLRLPPRSPAKDGEDCSNLSYDVSSNKALFLTAKTPNPYLGTTTGLITLSAPLLLPPTSGSSC